MENMWAITSVYIPQDNLRRPKLHTFLPLYRQCTCHKSRLRFVSNFLNVILWQQPFDTLGNTHKYTDICMYWCIYMYMALYMRCINFFFLIYSITMDNDTVMHSSFIQFCNKCSANTFNHATWEKWFAKCKMHKTDVGASNNPRPP